MAEQFKQLIRCKWCDWTGMSRQALYAHRKAHHPDTFNAVVVAETPQPIPTPPPPLPDPVKEPLLTPKEQYEKEFGVKIPDLVEPDEEQPGDSVKFDGDDPEIPFVFIMVAVILLMIISGAVIFRERIITLMKGKKPETKLYVGDDIYE